MPSPVGNDRRVVLHVRTLRGSGGGPDKTILHGAAYFNDSPYRLAAAYLHPPGDPGFAQLQRRAAGLGCPIFGLADSGPLDLKMVVSLLRLCRRLGVAIWHAHDYKSNLLGLLLRPFQPMLLVSTVHGWVLSTRRTPLYYAVDRWCLQRYDRVISVAAQLDREVERLGVPAERRSCLPNGVDSQAFQRRAPARLAPLRRHFNVPDTRLVVGGVGRLSEEKGFDVLIEASARLYRAGLDLEVWVAGEGPAGPNLRRLAERRGLGDRLRLIGYQPDPVTVFEALDVFVLSSRREGLPNVLLEALAMEVPVVATNVGGVAELIVDDHTGLLCPAGDDPTLGRMLGRLLADPALRARLAAAGRARVVQEFNFASRMAAEREIYQALRSARR